MNTVPSWFDADVSRETLDDLASYDLLVRKWNTKINLVSKADAEALWDRHIWDSAQVSQFLHPSIDGWVDLGSGGGFPGIVIAIFAKSHAPAVPFTLIESDARKCAFLRTAARELQLNVTVLNIRIEEATLERPDVITARALADLDTLFALAKNLQKRSTRFILPKGKSWRNEVKAAERNWHFHVSAHPSKTNPESVILEIENVRRAT